MGVSFQRSQVCPAYFILAKQGVCPAYFILAKQGNYLRLLLAYLILYSLIICRILILLSSSSSQPQAYCDLWCGEYMLMKIFKKSIECE